MKIKETFNKNGYEYCLFKGEKLNDKRYKAIYEQIDQLNGHQVVAYEVHIIQVRTANAKTIGHIEGEQYLQYPGNNDWGNLGWTYKELDKAEVRYNSILPPEVCSSE